eukprot:TRINITY_DN14221_c0_g1_i1.p1 TRINITY_DN14221_c0_g1~~TRINITY_DN14221_c0_g1_i1.p1  ORF type:complete len:353 (+),score=123.89 TRINITY_DN14221_c0_g1_i1:1516-2574(+)
MPLNLSQASLASGWRTPNNTGPAPVSPNSGYTRRLEIKVLCLEEQLHKLSDGIHPEVGELLEEITKLKVENESLGDSLKKEREGSAAKDLSITKLKNSLIERDARLLTLHEEDSRNKGEVSSSIATLKAALVEKTNALVSSRRETEAVAAKLSDVENRLNTLKRAHRDEIEELHGKLTTTLRESEGDDDAEQLRSEVARLNDLCAHLQSTIEEATASAHHDGHELNLKVKRLEKLCRSLEAQNESLSAELSTKEADIQSRMETLQSNATSEFNKQLEERINENDEKWLNVINAIREDIQACDSEIRLVSSREARKADLLQDYHVALTLMEEERNQLLKRLSESENDSVHSFH